MYRKSHGGQNSTALLRRLYTCISQLGLFLSQQYRRLLLFFFVKIFFLAFKIIVVHSAEWEVALFQFDNQQWVRKQKKFQKSAFHTLFCFLFSLNQLVIFRPARRKSFISHFFTNTQCLFHSRTVFSHLRMVCAFFPSGSVPFSLKYILDSDCHSEGDSNDNRIIPIITVKVMIAIIQNVFRYYFAIMIAITIAIMIVLKGKK